MKQSISLLLILGVSIVFIGCSEDNLLPAMDDPAHNLYYSHLTRKLSMGVTAGVIRWA